MAYKGEAQIPALTCPLLQNRYWAILRSEMKEKVLVDSGFILRKSKTKNKISILKPVVNSTELETSHLSIAGLQNLRHVPSFSRTKIKTISTFPHH